MKTVKALSVTFLIVLVLSISLVSFVSALEKTDVSVTTFMASDTKERGEQTSIRILFNSNTNKSLTIYYVGIHVDWMNTDQLYGIDYSSSPKTVAPMKSAVIDIINYTVPTSASLGAHKYYIGVDGYDEDGKAFSWTSDEATLYVTNPTGTNPPTSTSTPSSQNPQTFDTNMLLYVALIAAFAVIIVLLIAVFKMKKQNTAPADVSTVAPPGDT